MDIDMDITTGDRHGRGRYPGRNVAFAAALVCVLGLPESAPARGDQAASFRETCAEKAADGDGIAVPGIDGWIFLRAELRHLGVGPFWGADAAKVSRAKPEQADPVPAIVDFAQQLRDRGIVLILAPVPCKAAIYPEKLGVPAKEQGRVDAADREFLALLSDKGVSVLDLADAFLAAKADAAAGPVYCRTDTHWSPRGCEVAAAAITARIKSLDGAAEWLPRDSKAFTSAREERPVKGDLAGGGEPEIVPARVVTAAGGAGTEDRTSPVLLLGDSHALVFHSGAELHGTGAGVADQLALDLGMPIDVIGVRGSGATPARINLLRRAKSDSGWLAGKKVVVWCFAAREFTESSGWAVVPLPAAGK